MTSEFGGRKRKRWTDEPDRGPADDELAAAFVDLDNDRTAAQTDRLDSFTRAARTLSTIVGSGTKSAGLDGVEWNAACATLRKVLRAIGRIADADVEMLDREQRLHDRVPPEPISDACRRSARAAGTTPTGGEGGRPDGDRDPG